MNGRRSSPHLAAIGFALLFHACSTVSVTPRLPSQGGDPFRTDGLTGGTMPSPQAGTPRTMGSEEDAIRSELRALARAQDKYHSANGTYSSSVGALEEVTDYRSSASVRLQIMNANESGFAVVGSMGMHECASFTGGAPPPRDYVTAEGAVSCRRR